MCVALGKYDRYYVSQDDLDDQDDFSGHAGWQESQEGSWVEVSEPASYRTAREAREKQASDAAAKAKFESDAWDAARTQIPADYSQRHGALLGGVVTMSGANGTSSDTIYPPLAEFAQVKWVEVARYASKSYTGTWYGEILRSATLSDGRPIYELQSIQYDDYRTTFYLPADLYQVVLAAEVSRRGITREAAQEWLSRYRGCVDTDIYEFAATVCPAPEMIAL
jgi:hypothetical protein